MKARAGIGRGFSTPDPNVINRPHGDRAGGDPRPVLLDPVNAAAGEAALVLAVNLEVLDGDHQVDA
jgi:hypothetical protein